MTIINYILQTINANPGLSTSELTKLFDAQCHAGKGPLLKQMTIASYLGINKTYKHYFTTKIDTQPGKSRPRKTWYLSDLGISKLNASLS